MTATIPEQRRDAPVAEVQPVRLSRGRSVGGTLRAAGRAGGEGCQRCVEFVAGRYVKSGLLAAGSWPWLPSDWRVAEIVAAGVVIGGAGLSGRRQSLLRVGQVLKYRRRVRKVVKRWPRVIGVNADIKRIEKAVDVTGAPTRSPGHRHIPILLHGVKSWRLVKGLPRYFGPRRTPYGMVITVDGSPVGAVMGTFSAESEVIRGSLDALAVKVAMNRLRPHWTDISILAEDPFAATIPRAMLPAPSGDDSVVVGFDADGDPVEKSLWVPSLVVGESGAGKSSESHVVIAGIADRDWPLRLWVFDPKEGLEFAEYEHTAYRYVRSPYKWVDLLRELIETTQDKMRRLRGHGRQVDFRDPEFGLDVLVIDELLSTINFVDDNDKRNQVVVTVDGESRRMKPSEAFNHLLSQQRAARVVTRANSQMATKEKIKNRDMFPDVTVLRVAFDETVTMLGYSAKEQPAHQIPQGPAYSGIGFTKTDRGIVKYRSAFMTDAERAETARRVARWSEYYRARAAS